MGVRIKVLPDFIPSETYTNIEGCNRNDRPKRFWSFMKNLRRNSSGVSCLRDNGILKTGNKDKADIFSRQFGSVYENAGDIPLKGPRPFICRIPRYINRLQRGQKASRPS